MLSGRSKIAFVVDITCAAAFVALAGWLFYASSSAAAAAAIRDYGHNVDSGAVESPVAGIYCAPVAVAFGVGAAALYCEWRIKWYLHWLAVLFAVVPVTVEVLPTP